jgi:glycosyltransferase involved in cell wall biosynthesis
MTEHRYAVNARFVTQSLTGIQRYCYELALRLRNGSLLAPSAALEDYKGVQGRVNVTGGYLGGHPWEQFALPLAVPRRQALFSPAGCGPLAHLNQVITIHDLAPLENPEWYSPGFALWYSRLLPVLARRVRNIVTVSEFCKQRIVERLRVDERKVTVAWEAASSVFSPRSADETQSVFDSFGIRKPYFLFVGAVSGRKNLPRLLAAWNRVVDRLNGASLVMVGKTGLRFADKGALGALPKQVMQLGSVNDQDLACLYTAAQGLLYPSLYEGFGLPILEAMACGCPVLTSSCTAMPEVAGDSAIIVDALSEDAIASGIRELMDENRAADLRRRGFRRCRDFSWERTAQIVETALLS